MLFANSYYSYDRELKSGGDGNKWIYKVFFHNTDKTRTKTVKNCSLTDAEYTVHSFCCEELLKSGIITREKYTEYIERLKKYLFK